MITGDLNVVAPGHDPHYPVFGPWEYEFHRSFAAAGFTDAYRICRPEGIDHSWFGHNSNDGRRNGYRFDHTFITTTHTSTVREFGQEVASGGWAADRFTIDPVRD